MINFNLDRTGRIPIYRQIIDQIRFGIATGRLLPGEQLPAVRAIAQELYLNLNTVAKAYKELEILKILETRHGTGTFVGSVKVEINPQELTGKLTAICTECCTTASLYGFSIDDIIEELKKLKMEENHE